MSNLNCYYAEDCRFDTFLGWLRATQHCACNKWLPTCRWLQSIVNLQSYSNLQSQNRTESCEEFQKKKSITIQICLSKNDNMQIHQYIEMSQDLNPSRLHVHLWSFSRTAHAKTTLSMQRQPRSCNNIFSFLQWTAPIARSFCEDCTWHHLNILVKAPLCGDWKGRAASAQRFPLSHQATLEIPRGAQLISACSRHMGVVLHAHPFCVELHIHHNASWEAATLTAKLG